MKGTIRFPTYRTCFDQSSGNAENGDEENARSIVIVLIHRPKNQAGNLKYIERMKCLQESAHILYGEQFTNFVYEKLRNRLLLYVD